LAKANGNEARQNIKLISAALHFRHIYVTETQVLVSLTTVY